MQSLQKKRVGALHMLTVAVQLSEQQDLWHISQMHTDGDVSLHIPHRSEGGCMGDKVGASSTDCEGGDGTGDPTSAGKPTCAIARLSATAYL